MTLSPKHSNLYNPRVKGIVLPGVCLLPTAFFRNPSVPSWRDLLLRDGLPPGLGK